MTFYSSTQDLVSQLSAGTLKRGDIKKMAKEIKKDHDLAMELWETEGVNARLLSVLIMDKNQLTQEEINRLAQDMEQHDVDQRLTIAEWLMANQLMKSKKTIALLQSWEKADAPILRRLFWYHQARLRWSGQTSPDNTEQLLDSLESDMETADPMVQWAMNFTAGWIGVYDAEHRERCIELGERLGLYKGDPVSRNCTPNYLPEFIDMEVAKRAA